MVKTLADIDQLIEIIRRGGKVKTGIDVYNENGVLLLEKDVLVEHEKTLLRIKESGITDITINETDNCGIWDKNGNRLSIDKSHGTMIGNPVCATGIEKKIIEITKRKKEASLRYQITKKNIKKVISDIKKTGGNFEYNDVENTVSELLSFMDENENAFSFLTKEILSYDDYLYNHSINVCTIATAILKTFNTNFSHSLNTFISSKSPFPFDKGPDVGTFSYYLPEELYSMSIGYYLHDIGKVLIPIDILNKKGRLTAEEFVLVKTHSYVKGIEVIEKNNINNPFITNSIRYHHSAIFNNEEGCYPDTRRHHEIPIYVKVCKLADIYDAMTSKRCYKEAVNPINVVAEIFHKYARKDPMLQFILHAFVTCIGIHPPGSIIFLENGQMAYVLDSKGPIIIPFTDKNGATLKYRSDPIDLGEKDMKNSWKINTTKAPIAPIDVYNKLPSFLK
jgi:HD-GYP domain-containing protein (c-di-GMP phosphodiesterase class II)